MSGWMDGDYLTPANLNAKGVGGAFTDRTVNAADYAGATKEARITTASTTTAAGLRLPHGTAPSAPVDGDLWSTTTGLFVRINGATKAVVFL